MILLDTSALFAAFDPAQPEHEQVVAAIRGTRPPRLLSPFVLAELDYFISEVAGVDAELAMLREVERGAYRLEEFSPRDITAARQVIARFRDLRIGLADASIVVLSRRHGVNDVLTLDERHFRVLRGARDRPFRVLPADA